MWNQISMKIHATQSLREQKNTCQVSPSFMMTKENVFKAHYYNLLLRHNGAATQHMCIIILTCIFQATGVG